MSVLGAALLTCTDVPARMTKEKFIQARSPNWHIIDKDLTTTFNNVIFSAQRLGYFRIQKRDKRESPEWFRDKHVCYFPKLAKIVTQVVGCYILSTTTDEYFARYLWSATLMNQCTTYEKPLTNGYQFDSIYRFRVGNFDITPSTVNKVPLRKDAHLRIVVGETDETETFALASFCIFFDLDIM